jgi:hypothetical protein
MIQTKAIKLEGGGFIQNHFGSGASSSSVTVAANAFPEKRENRTARTVNGTNLKIQFFKRLKKIWNAFKLVCIRYQLIDNTVEIIRSERSGKWCSHSDYIRETLEREKMRSYEFR